MPVTYAAIACIAFFASILILPFIKYNAIKALFYFLIGTGIPICIYCIIFLADPWEQFGKNYLELFPFSIIFGLGLFAYIPFYLMVQIYKYFKTANLPWKIAFTLGWVLPFIAFCIYLKAFKTNYDNYIQAYKRYGNSQQFVNVLPKHYFTERFLGIGFKYHTKYCFYDGWRPPLHDPFLNAALWIYGQIFFTPPVPHNPNPKYKLSNGTFVDIYGNESLLKYKILYYKQLFPSKPIRVDCPCSYTHDGESYFTSYGWPSN